jgi:hypothetical protein
VVFASCDRDRASFLSHCGAMPPGWAALPFAQGLACEPLWAQLGAEGGAGTEATLRRLSEAVTRAAVAARARTAPPRTPVGSSGSPEDAEAALAAACEFVLSSVPELKRFYPPPVPAGAAAPPPGPPPAALPTSLTLDAAATVRAHLGQEPTHIPSLCFVRCRDGAVFAHADLPPQQQRAGSGSAAGKVSLGVMSPRRHPAAATSLLPPALPLASEAASEAKGGGAGGASTATRPDASAFGLSTLTSSAASPTAAPGDASAAAPARGNAMVLTPETTPLTDLHTRLMRDPMFFPPRTWWEADPAPESHAEAKPETAAATHADPMPESHTEAKPETAAATHAEPTPESHAEAKPETAAATHADPMPESHAEAKPETAAATHAEPTPESHAEAKLESGASSASAASDPRPSTAELHAQRTAKVTPLPLDRLPQPTPAPQTAKAGACCVVQ